MLWVLYGLVILLAGGLHLLVDGSVRDSAGLTETFLLYVLVVGVGVAGIVGFIGHAFRPTRSLRPSAGREAARFSSRWQSRIWRSVS